MTDFEPVAIVGRGCVFPGAFSPQELWQRLLRREDLLSYPTEEDWGLSARGIDRWIAMDPWATRGGYIRGFDRVFDPGVFRIPSDEVAQSDPLVQWTLFAARNALSEAGIDPDVDSSRAGIILGNLSLPSRGLAAYTESVWTKRLERELGLDGFHRLVTRRSAHAAERFMSGRPSHLVAKAFGLNAGAMALDAACASSLYALRLACDWLRDRRADLMLAGAVNGADPLVLHTGFRVLRASSKSGRSRPFHRDADGLVPAEGAGIVALKRLSDAIASGDRILGIIRGVGLSNDGSDRGILAPAMSGQVDAMRRAYRMSGVKPDEISFVECHATGTAVGDAAELESMKAIFGSSKALKIGSSKSNLGHSVTASGMAGLMKVLSGFETGVLPPNINTDDPLPEAVSGDFRLLTEETEWSSDVPRLAAISSFGFGGNNTHLIVEESSDSMQRLVREREPTRRGESPSLAIVGIGTVTGTARGKAGLMEVLDASNGNGATRRNGTGSTSASDSPEWFSSKMAEVRLDSSRLKYPPKDLEATLPQQLSLLEAAQEAMAETSLAAADRVGVFAAMECDAEAVHPILAIRSGDWVDRWNAHAGPDAPALSPTAVPSLFGAELTAAGVIGILPNMVANRLNHFFDVRGPSFSVSSEELSGHDAFATAAGLLRSGEIDAAIVGASELSCEPVHAAASQELLGRGNPGDAAVALVMRRVDDAEKSGDRIYAIVSGDQPPSRVTFRLGDGEDAVSLASIFGFSHTANGLLHAAVGALSCYYGVRSDGEGVYPWPTSGQPRVCSVSTRAFLGRSASLYLQSEREGGSVPLVTQTVPAIHLYAGANRPDVIDRVTEDRKVSAGPCRLVIVAATEAVRAERCRAAIEWLGSVSETRGVMHPSDGIFYSEAAGGGELAFVFTGAAVSYRGMGGALALAFPEALPDVRSYEDAELFISPVQDASSHQVKPFSKLVATAFLSLFHATLSTTVMNLRPQATVGLSAGETNALISMGAWEDHKSLFDEFRRDPLFDRGLAPPFTVLQSAWPPEMADWTNYRVLAPVDEVRELVKGEPHVFLTVIHTDSDCLISGNPAACGRVIDRIGAHRAIHMNYDLVIHCPLVEQVGPEWRRLHSRPTRPVPGLRFYSSHDYHAYTPQRDRCAEALLGMAVRTVDFPRLIETAWSDGVRVFVEHGPRNLCGNWIREILGDRDATVVSMDERSDRSIRHFVEIVAQLLAYGYDIDQAAIIDRLRGDRLPQVGHESAPLRFSAHRDALPMTGDLLTESITIVPLPPTLPLIADAGQEIRAPETDGQVAERVAPPNGSVPSPSLREHGPGEAIARLTRARHAHLASVHRDFVRRQTGVHRQYLAGVVRAEAEILTAVSAQGRGVAPEVRAPSLTGETNRISPTGPTLSREQLEVLAAGKISSIFGPLFERQDEFDRQVRMPEPPLLLADRVLGIEGEPGSMGTGTIWTATDVADGAWYLHDGYMPFGILVEAGQADLLLISWLGADFLNRDQRVYRLLGCEMTFHGRLPKPGDLLEYEIHIDGHATDGDVRLFFFRYDCYLNGEICLTMRNGQAGFFTDEELCHSKGVIWSPEDAPTRDDAPPDPPRAECTFAAFSPEQVERFAEGAAYECFGAGFELAAAHVRTPRIPNGMMKMLHEVTEFDPRGGPAGKGYLRAETPLTGEEWYFPCHFKGDPAMPGTLMMEGCFQAISFYLTALGLTLNNDGYRFEIVPDRAYEVVCRGQATPRSRQLVYEIFVAEVIGGPIPEVVADVLVTVDGLKAFACEGMAVRLVPDWPLSSRRELLAGHREASPVARVDGFAFGYPSLLACAWGNPTDAFGPSYQPFNGTRRLPRLPGPPYHFVSRVTMIDGEMGEARIGTTVEVEYDLPPEAWYFTAPGTAVMPYCVVLECALQPCGWLTAFIGIPLECASDLHFRNLDGTGTLHRELSPRAGVLSTRVRLTNLSRMGDTFIEGFTVECRLSGELVYSLDTVFGHFPEGDLVQQVGLSTEPAEEESWLEESPYLVDLRERPARFYTGMLRLPDPPLLTLDRLTGYWPRAKEGSVARFRAEKTVNPDDWFFKAHFYQDPVQPGSLGIEAMIQLLQAAMIELDLAGNLRNPRFEPIRIEEPLSWKYRGQILPTHRRILTLVEVTETGEDDRGVYATATASTIVDGVKIYHAERLGMRIVEGSSGRKAT